MRCFQNVRLINLRHLLTMVEQLIRLIVHSRSILRPPRSSKFPDRSLPPAIRPPSWCSTSLLFSSNHVKFYVIKTQHSFWYLDSQTFGSRFWLLLSRPSYPEGRVITFSPPLNRICPQILSCANAQLRGTLLVDMLRWWSLLKWLCLVVLVIICASPSARLSFGFFGSS